MSIKELNKLNFVLNNDKCSSSYINDICKYLDKDGLKYESSNDLSVTDTDGKVVITLDQINNTGVDSTIITSYDNNRYKSHVLALCLRAAYHSNNVNVLGLYSGKVGFNNIHLDGKIPSTTEDSVDSEVPFASISFGTSKINPRIIAYILEETLARYDSYMKNYGKPSYNLIYRTTKADKVQDISYIKKKLNLNEVNVAVDKGMLVPGQTLIGNIKGIKEFDYKQKFIIN